MRLTKKKTAPKALGKKLPPPYKYTVTSIPENAMAMHLEKIAEANKILQNTKWHDPDFFR